MIKVLFLIDTLNGGGAEKILIDIIDNLDKAKFDITIMTVWEKGIYTDIVKRKYNYKTIFTSKLFSHKLINFLIEKFINLSNGKLLHKLFIKDDYDIEVAFLEGISTKIISGAKKKTTKISWIHTEMKNNKWYEQFYINNKSIIKTYKRLDKIIAVSKSCKDVFVNLFNINNVEVIYNPVNNKNILQKSQCRTNLINSNDKIKIVTVGRLEYEKGYDRLIKIAKQLRDDNFNFEIYIIGTGSLEPELKKQIDLYGLSKNVFLLGYLDNPYCIVNKCDLFVCSSRTEGFSTVVTEALVLGIPIVTTSCSGMKELLEDNKYGIITENNEESLYNAIKYLLEDTELLQRYKDKASIRGRKFTLEKSIIEIESILKY